MLIVGFGFSVELACLVGAGVDAVEHTLVPSIPALALIFKYPLMFFAVRAMHVSKALGSMQLRVPGFKTSPT